MRRLGTCFALISLGLLASGAARADSVHASREYEIKAAYLYNFTKFVEWPQQALAAGAPLVLGAFCDDSFTTTLSEVVKGREVNGHHIEVRRLFSAEEARTVQVAFVCAAYDGKYAGMKTVTTGLPVLTVGETPESESKGAAITFVLDDDKVRFAVNTEPAERVGLKISAQLQKLAVHRDP